MLKSYLKIALRSLLKNRLQTSINLLGLTVGTVCCLSILVYVFAQLGYDSHHEDADDLYRVGTSIVFNDGNGTKVNTAACSPPIGFALKQDFPEVTEACRLVYFGEGNDALLRVKGQQGSSAYASHGYLADSTIFKLFHYRFEEGRAEGALTAPNTIVLSSSLAKKMFGKQSALNQNLILGSGSNETILIVTGVFEDQSEKSHLAPNYILSMNSKGLGQFVMNENNFATQNFTYTYIRLLPGTDAEQVAQKLPEFLQRRGAADIAAIGFEKTLLLQKVKDIHLYSKGIKNQIEGISDIQYLYFLLVLALFIQLVACVNFINLSTARANRRGKEIGVRKAIGAHRGALVRQFLGESVLLSLFAFLISIPITALLLPLFNALTQGNAQVMDVLALNVILPLLALSIISGLFAGAYPALVLAAIQPINVLKGTVRVSSGSGNFRKALVVFQFVVSIALIAGVIIVNKQVNYSLQKDLGFDKQSLIALRLGTEDAKNSYEGLKSGIASVPGVTAVTGSNHYPSEFILGDLGLHLPGQDPTLQKLVKYNGISLDYLETTGIPLLVGRALRANDSTQVLVNKATLDAFGIPLEEALATPLIQTYEGEVTVYNIAGVVADFHYASLKDAIAPLMLFNESRPNWLILQASTKDFQPLLAQIDRYWKESNPTTPFVYTFVDREVAKLFAEETRLGKISLVFTGLAILINCLGLFGLISFVAEQKKKEIGIRKVLGAGVGTVIGMLTKDFVKLAMIALLIAAPMAYYFMNDWLQGFAYRVTIHWWTFAIAGAVTLLITLLTIGLQAFKAATANPTQSLRTE